MNAISAKIPSALPRTAPHPTATPTPSTLLTLHHLSPHLLLSPNPHSLPAVAPPDGMKTLNSLIPTTTSLPSGKILSLNLKTTTNKTIYLKRLFLSLSFHLILNLKRSLKNLRTIIRRGIEINLAQKGKSKPNSMALSLKERLLRSDNL